MKLTILGFYGGYPTNDVGTTGYLIQSGGFNLLLDVGSATVLELEKQIDPLDLDAVLLTHYHPDHIADVGVLQHVRMLKPRNDGKKTPILPIYAHDENSTEFEKLTMDEVSEGRTYNHADLFEIGPFKLTHMKTLHPVPTFAFRIEEKETGKVLVFTADSGYLEKFIPFAKGAHLLLTDTNLFAGNEGHQVHMTSKECGIIAREAGVEKLVLTHLPQEGNHEQLKEEAQKEVRNTEVILASKGLTLEI